MRDRRANELISRRLCVLCDRGAPSIQIRATSSGYQGDVAWRLWQMIADDPAHPPGMDEAARAMHCSTRTLARKLVGEGWQYQQLIDQVREIHARRGLSDPSQSITRIAHQLGYADSSGFHRAFKKWTGLSPTVFRERLFA